MFTRSKLIYNLYVSIIVPITMFTFHAMRKRLFWCVGILLSIGATILLIVVGWCAFILYPEIPDVRKFHSYHPSLVTRFYTEDLKIMDEHAIQNRVFIPYQQIPDRVIQAFMAAEDKNFFQHCGIDFFAITRTILMNFYKRKVSGASTITQQVARTIVLNDQSLSVKRKIKELMVAILLERYFSKKKIIEMYLNGIYLGRGMYGVGTVSLAFFNKPLSDLTLSEMAFLAALPKAPAYYDPLKNPEICRARRNWVLSRMKHLNYISESEYEAACAEKLPTFKGRHTVTVCQADYFSEYIRRIIMKKYGSHALYQNGLRVYTTLNAKLQHIARDEMRRVLEIHDKKLGYRGSCMNIPSIKRKSWVKQIKELYIHNMPKNFHIAMVTEVTADKLSIVTELQQKGVIHLNSARWAYSVAQRKAGSKARVLNSFFDILQPGDIIWVRTCPQKNNNTTPNAAPETPMQEVFLLEQIPELNGAVVIMRPQDGAILAMVGGYSLERSPFNRAHQSKISLGSLIKPFIVALALETRKITRDTIVNDEETTWIFGPFNTVYTPQNHDKKFLGPISLERALIQSRNPPMVYLGMHYLNLDETFRFLSEELKLVKPNAYNFACPSMMLGSHAVTVVDVAGAYCALATGFYVKPYAIHAVQNFDGEILFRAQDVFAINENISILEDISQPPTFLSKKPRIFSEDIVTEVYDILHKGVITIGTTEALSKFNLPVAAKTGTSSNQRQTWCVVYNKDYVIVVYVGYDQERVCGYGSKIALPIAGNIAKKIIKKID